MRVAPCARLFVRARLVVACAVSAVAAGVPACSSSTERVQPPERAHLVTLSIVSTNDVHGQLERLPILAGFIDNLRRSRTHGGGVLLIDAGDTFQGTIESNLNEGAAAIAAYNRMHYAALAIGNHDFDFGPAGPSSIPRAPNDDPFGALKQRAAEARFPFLSANVTRKNDGRPDFPNVVPSAMTTVAGIRVGLVGLLTEDAENIIKRTNFAGLHVTPLAEAAIREARALRSRHADVVIVIAHAGGKCLNFDNPEDLSSCDANSEIFRLARAIPSGLVDVVVGGHRDESVAHSVAGVPVVHARSHLEAFSRVDLVFDADARRVSSKHIYPPKLLCGPSKSPVCEPGTYEGAPVHENAEVTAAIRPSLEVAKQVREQRLGVHVDKPFVATKRSECALGNLFADLMREAVPRADVAMANGGSLRHDLPAGELTLGALHRAMPFDNQLATLSLSGAQFRAIMRANVTQDRFGILSISGARARVSCEDGQVDIELTRTNGKAIRDNERLLLVTNDFLAMGGDGLLAAIDSKDVAITLDTGKTVWDALVGGIQRRGGALREGDRSLFDPSRPRILLPGPLPVVCH